LKHYLVQKDFETLKKDIKDKETRLIQLSKQLGEAAKKSSSFVSNNPEYIAILDQVDALQMSIDTQKEFLAKTEVIKFKDIKEDIIDVYSLVTVENVDTGDNLKYYIHYPNVIGEDSATDFPIASPFSPIGKALIGKKVADVLEVELPNRKLQLKIVEINKINL
jgi:transcription elongation factor GreA